MFTFIVYNIGTFRYHSARSRRLIILPQSGVHILAFNLQVKFQALIIIRSLVVSSLGCTFLIKMYRPKNWKLNQPSINRLRIAVLIYFYRFFCIFRVNQEACKLKPDHELAVANLNLNSHSTYFEWVALCLPAFHTPKYCVDEKLIRFGCTNLRLPYIYLKKKRLMNYF